MLNIKNKFFLAAASALLMLCGALPARADVTQTLDSVDAIASKSVLAMRFGQTLVPPTYDLAASLPATSSGYAACQRSANHNLYCLLNSYSQSGQLTQPVRRYKDSGTTDDLFSCSDPALGLDTKKANPCTSLTTDLAGNIWLGGRDGTAYRVIKVVTVPAGTSCSTVKPAGFQPLAKNSTNAPTDDDYCFLAYATGRPIIIDLYSVDGKTAANFLVQGAVTAAGAGILVLEDRKTVDFVSDPVDSSNNPLPPVAPVTIASGKTDWGLIGSEGVQSVSLLQLNAVADCTSNCAQDSYLLIATSLGRLIAKRTDPIGAAFPVTTIPACTSTLTPQYWVRVSAQSGAVYVADRTCTTVRSYTVTNNGSSASPPFAFSASTALSTSASGDTLNTLSVSPGIGIDLSKCSQYDTSKCVLYPDGNANGVGAYISQVDIELNGKTGLTVFRINGIPDCRRYPPSAMPAPCSSNSIKTVNGVAGFLDVATLLPAEVLHLFTEFTSPKASELQLLISPTYVARGSFNSAANTVDYKFQAFFGRTEDGVLFRDPFLLKYDIEDLTGTGQVRCGFQKTTAYPNGQQAVDWDAITTVSERYVTGSIADNLATATQPAGHVDMLVNTNCENPTSGSGTRWSLYAYGLELADCASQSPTSPSLQCQEAFVSLTDKLFDDLERARKLTACTDVDGNGQTPLSTSTCSLLASDWVNARDKLNKCLDATTTPKISSLSQNCQSFVTQFQQYQNHLAAAVVNGPVDPVTGIQTGDKANRLGELRSRVAVFNYIYTYQFLPSVPAGGFPQ